MAPYRTSPASRSEPAAVGSAAMDRFCRFGAGAVPAGSAAGQRLHDHDLVALGDGTVQIAHDLTVDEHPHVRAEAAVLVDHPEADARVTAVEVGQQRGDRVAERLDLGATVRVGAEGRRDPDVQRSGTPCSTE